MRSPVLVTEPTVELSVHPSVCPSDASYDHEIFTDGYSKDFSFGDKKFFQKLESVRPERGR